MNYYDIIIFIIANENLPFQYCNYILIDSSVQCAIRPRNWETTVVMCMLCVRASMSTFCSL